MAKVSLELSLKCTELQLPANFSEGVFVAVHHCQPNHGFWSNHLETDVIRGSNKPVFLKTVSFFIKDNVTEDTRMRFIVYRVSKNKDITEQGTCFCVVGDITAKDEVKLDLQNKGNYTGTLVLTTLHASDKTKKRLVSRSSSGKAVVPVDASLAESVKPKSEQEFTSITKNPVLKSMFSNAICRTYKFPTEGGEFIRAQELMMESCLSFRVPIHFLKLLVDEETKKIGSLESIGKLTGHWEAVRRRRVDSLKKYLDRYQARIKHMMMHYHAPFFKKSVDKMSEELEFVPTNLHIQKMTVQNLNNEGADDSSNSSRQCHTFNYDITTVGATTAHAMGFKHGGGLLAQLANAGDGSKSRKSLPLNSMDQCLKPARSSEIFRNNRFLEKINSLHNQVVYEVEKLRNLTKHESGSKAYASNKVTGSSEALAHLSNKVCQLITCCECELVQNAVKSLEAARPAYKPLHENYVHGPPNTDVMGSSVLVETDDSVSFNSSSSCSDLNDKVDSLWEDLTLRAKSKLSDVVKSVHSIITPDLEASFLRGQATTDTQRETALNDLSILLDLVQSVCAEVNASLSFMDLNHTEQQNDFDLAYRRNVVFSQALTTIAATVQNHILTSIDNQLKLHQFSEVGIFIQVESLLSTYGNELGMLQDYAVGVNDMKHVTVKCSTANKDESHGSDRYLPTLHGTTSAMIITLHFDDSTFELLPIDLQKGKLIKLHPVMYSVGINEEQTLAERFGSTAVQEYLNQQAYESTMEYYDMVRDQCPNCLTEKLRNANSFIREISKDKISASFPEKKKSLTNLDENRSIMEVVNFLRQAVHSKRNKNVEILQLAGDLCRKLNGARITSCKSAKDRTAMSVTLEQARILAMEHGLANQSFNQVLTCMRSQGTRRENTLKNVGARRYAFTSMQLMTFPKQYRAPEGTYGKAES
uniref:type I inositol 3,4-bisphosphate 4-phosphatase isoform X1 n=1 Tax=Ciona intestinalis TaxID=7719 RepID=UPI000180C828|nr:type I inositol 3,4-bisphosphate 4-phosphatase isoform X1 [Ciona intestinalis]XP_026693483.1 type I inositol 3,4-bisphosphate 4-phosphatase isoform X1 [Ciona intestinalis]XP_026693484.1 type I inositol 3,4-bisphosphate 4-phosphatase isoform X1 [Ciona intestinalis]XP_026693485.1 type I inositol 3,4-bisphosphate 4-phosphatase isoform X1 [Ciona intestinalis]XP_026693486.1 type I inositol 3,4-bisphosphate 4-phosphatase isoform X1 [Ciona intestinalis]|eukprot:XP_026693482.1 type I inositol 3,4-bisphosphate 4-phosphatase isoform X1 [Ciona intestinalis]